MRNAYAVKTAPYILIEFNELIEDSTTHQKSYKSHQLVDFFEVILKKPMALVNMSKPIVLVFAGPNGSGKSTITKLMPLTGVYINL